MAIYTDDKPELGDIGKINANDSEWRHVEPLITPEALSQRQLFGIPLVSGTPDPITQKYQRMTPEHIKDFIDQAVLTVEQETGIEIFPVQYDEKKAFDKAEYDSFGFFQLDHKPVASVQSVDIFASDQNQVFHMPIEWIDIGHLQFGQLNMIPLGQAVGNAGFIPSGGGSGGVFFVNLLAHKGYIPSWWQIKYTTGFPNGMLPKYVNALVGTIAAMEILSILGATWARRTSHSLGVDGLSQSVSTPGPELYKTRRDDLAATRKLLVGRIRKRYGTQIFSGNV